MRSTTATDDENVSTTERRIRIRVLLAEYRTVLVAGFVVILALGGWVSYGAYAVPGEETERQLEHSWTATGEFAHGATVTESSAVYAAGTELEDEQLYYTAVTPTVDGEFVAGYEAGTAEDVRVDITVDLVYREVDPDGGTSYWTSRDQVTSTSETDVAPNEDVTASFAVNVTEAETTLESIRNDLGASPGQGELALEIEREIAGSIDGRQQAVTDRYQIPIANAGGTYRIEADGTYDEPYDEYETTAVPASPGPARSLGGPLLLGIGVVGLGGLAVASSRLSEPRAADRAWLEYRNARSEFAAVITTVRLPSDAIERPHVEVGTLSALAEIGIDLESVVLFDTRSEQYVVRTDDLTYVFDPPALDSSDDDAKAPAATDPDGDGDTFFWADGQSAADSGTNEDDRRDGGDRREQASASDEPAETDSPK